MVAVLGAWTLAARSLAPRKEPEQLYQFECLADPG